MEFVAPNRVRFEAGEFSFDRYDAFIQKHGAKYKGFPPAILEMLRAKPPEKAEAINVFMPDKLLEYQREGVLRIIGAGGRMILGDEMGLGKTLQALIAMVFYRSEWPLLIVCPASLREHWCREVREWGFTAATASSKVPCDPDTNVHVVSYECMSAGKFTHKCVIFDESHYIKSLSSKRTKQALAISAKAKRVILISGTPGNRPADLYPQLRAVTTKFLDGFHSPFPKKGNIYYADRYCKPEKQFVHGGRQVFVFKGAERLDELNRITSPYIIRRLKADVLDLPPLIRERVTLYTRDDKVTLDSEDLESEDFMQKVRDLAAEKSEYVVKYLENVIKPQMDDDPELKVLIFGHHRVVLDAISEVFPGNSIRIDGSVPPAARMALVDRFQTDASIRAAVLSISATGVGLTLTRGSLSIFAELVFGPDQTSQAEARTHRMGQRNSVVCRYLVAGNSTDDVVWGILNRKVRVAAQMLDGQKDVYLNAKRLKVSSDASS